MYALGRSWLNPEGPKQQKMKVVAFLMWISLTILLSRRGPWCIKWCQCHNAELDLRGDEAVRNDNTKGTIPPSWALRMHFLNTSLLCPGQRKLFYAGRKQIDNPKLLCQTPFSSSYLLFFTSCHSCHAPVRKEPLSISPEITL